MPLRVGCLGMRRRLKNGGSAVSEGMPNRKEEDEQDVATSSRPRYNGVSTNADRLADYLQLYIFPVVTQIPCKNHRLYNKSL